MYHCVFFQRDKARDLLRTTSLCIVVLSKIVLRYEVAILAKQGSEAKAAVYHHKMAYSDHRS
ncbi:hypothetical protein TUM20903_10260 [Citrobacter koseri]|nr:hypothetical protein TUM13189_09960 [Citrobacter koseri]BDG88288.1 hypothetical protein TUM20903_10260 [Citrobacter koseri]